MKASVGDRIVVMPPHAGGRVLAGVIVELRHPDGTAPYVVRWEDTGESALYFPGSDSRLLPAEPDVDAETVEQIDLSDRPAREVKAGRVRTWTVDIELVEDGDETTARAVLRADVGRPLEARHGRAVKAPRDSDVPGIGDDVAAARALRHLSERLLSRAEACMSELERRDVNLTH